MNTPNPGATDAPTNQPASADEANRPPVSAQDWMPEARELAAQCWCDDETRHTTMDVVLAEAVARRIASWMSDAARSQRDADYYRGLVVRCGKAFGKAAHIADDGSDMQDVLCAKVPELVEALVAAHPPVPPDTHPPATLPWQDAALDIEQGTGPGSTEDIIRRACEQWARYACENWRRHDAEMHKALALCRSVLEEVRPIVKARLIDMDDLRAPLCDGSILDRIESALADAPAADTGGKEGI